MAGGLGDAAFEVILAQEGLVRGVGRVGLVLVDERRRLVDFRIARRRRAGQSHEGEVRVLRQRQFVARIGDTVCADDHQRIVSVQRHVDRAIAALVDEVEAVVEELAEEGHPGVERSRQAFVRRNGRDGDRVAIAHHAKACDHSVKGSVGSCFLRRRRSRVAEHDMHGSKGRLDRLKRTACAVDLASEFAIELGEGQRSDDGRRVVERHV